MGTKIVYNHKAIEKKWREKWEETPVNPRNGKDGNKKPKYYCLDMFPYPSGSGLHVGHWRGYVISDVWSRYQLLKGKSFIQWDGMHSVFRLRTMRSRWAFTRRNPQRRTSRILRDRSMISQHYMTGIWK